MSELSANACRKQPDGSEGPRIRITLTSTADLGQYESAMHELAYSIGITMLMENKNFLYEVDVDSESIEKFKAAARQKEKARKPGISEAVLDKVIAGKLQHFLSEQAAENSTLLPTLQNPVWREIPQDATIRDALFSASHLLGANVIATFSRTA